ncbi:MAG: DMT family transporter [Chloroflexi bacterium]|nr:DMT family transporter [Chloroflexota bacterium]
MDKHLSIGYIFAIAAALAYAINSIVIKKGLSSFGSPLAGATIAMSFGLMALSILSVRASELRAPNSKRGALFLGIAGISAAIGVSANYIALSLAPVVVIAPITSMTPMITILGAHLFLRGTERITSRLVVGSALVVLGVIIITLGRHML